MMVIQVGVQTFLLTSERVSKVFDMGEEEHDIILQKVQESKVRPSNNLIFPYAVYIYNSIQLNLLHNILHDILIIMDFSARLFRPVLVWTLKHLHCKID